LCTIDQMATSVQPPKKAAAAKPARSPSPRAMADPPIVKAALTTRRSQSLIPGPKRTTEGPWPSTIAPTEVDPNGDAVL
jgi:hypothetical protein